MTKDAGKKGPVNRAMSSAKKPAKAEKASPRPVKAVKAVNIRKSPLAKPELEEFRQMLLGKRRDLVGDMTGIQAEAVKSRQGGSGDLSNMPTHLADIGTDNFEHEFSLGLLESERSLLKEIDEALERVANGTYGICLGTGEPISKTRLRARPWARYCIAYALMLEKGLVRPPQEHPEAVSSDDEEAEPEEREEEEVEVVEPEEGPEEEE